MSVLAIPLRRGLLWAVLVLALVGVGIAAFLETRQSPLPRLGIVPDFRLINRDGRTVGKSQLVGAPWVADFIFTHCPSSCPLLTERMARFERSLPPDLPVRFVSFSVDPERDTPAVLQAYAAKYQAPARWLFLTGEREAIYRLSRDGFRLAIDPSPPPPPQPTDTPGEPILHSTRFVLVDGAGHIRGYYGALQPDELERLRRDLRSLSEP